MKKGIIRVMKYVRMNRDDVLTFGTNRGKTVGWMVDRGEWGPPMLRQYYYNVKNVDFTENVLRSIGVEKGDEIHKPGSAPHIRKRVERRLWSAMTEEEQNNAIETIESKKRKRGRGMFKYTKAYLRDNPEVKQKIY